MSKHTVDIHVDTSLVYDPELGWQSDHRIYVRLHRHFLDSGLLASLKGNELKTFLALALQARRLEQGPLFEYLAERALVTESDLGTIICYQWQEMLADQAGLHRNTLSKQIETLIGRHLIERRMVRDAGARYSKPLFLIYAGAVLDTEEARAEKVGTEGASEVRAQGLCAGRAEILSTGEPRAQKLGRIQANVVVDDHEPSEQQQEPSSSARELGTGDFSEIDAVWAELGRLLGRPYTPGVRDYAHVQTLLDDGYTLPGILAGLRRAVAQARARGTAPRSFGYCVPAIRDRPPDEGETAPLRSLPDDLLADLSALGWAGSLLEVEDCYAADPGRVRALLDFWLQNDDPHVQNPAALFRADLRSGRVPPEPEPPPFYAEPDYLEQVQALREAAAQRRSGPAPHPEANALWQRLLPELALQLPAATFDLHLRGSIAVGWEPTGEAGRKLVVWVPRPPSIPWIEGRLMPTVIRRTLSRLDAPLDLRFIADPVEVVGV